MAGASYLIQATPLASDGVTQNGPVAMVYFDPLDREIARDTQGFDGSTIRALRQYDSIRAGAKRAGRSLSRAARRNTPFTL